MPAEASGARPVRAGSQALTLAGAAPQVLCDRQVAWSRPSAARDAGGPGRGRPLGHTPPQALTYHSPGDGTSVPVPHEWQELSGDLAALLWPFPLSRARLLLPPCKFSQGSQSSLINTLSAPGHSTPMQSIPITLPALSNGSYLPLPPALVCIPGCITP